MDERTKPDESHRRTPGVGTTLVALAWILGLVSLGACGTDDSTSGAGTRGGTVSQPPSQPSSPTVSSADGAGGGPAAAPARPSYLLDGVVHRSDGGSFRPDVEGRVVTFTELADGRWLLGTETGRSRAQLVVASPAGAVVATHRLAASTTLAVSADHTTVAWLDPELRPHTLSAGADEPTSLPPIGGAPAGGDGGRLTTDNIGNLAVYGDCAEACSVLVSIQRPDGSSEVWRSTSSEAEASTWTSRLLDVTDVSPDGQHVTGTTKLQLDPTGLCSAVVELSSGARAWETCATSILRFSPSGTHLLGIDPYLDGAYHGQQFVLDAATGKIVSRVQRPTSDEIWLSDDSYVASELGPNGWRLVRHDLDGTSRPLTEAAYDSSGDETASPYRLALS